MYYAVLRNCVHLTSCKLQALTPVKSFATVSNPSTRSVNPFVE